MAKMQDANSALQASSELTSSLSQALGMLSNEVAKSEEMTKTLGDSTQVMQKTSNEYRTLSMAVRSSRQLITKLQRRDWTDRLLLLFGLLVFTLTVLSILRRRLWIWVPGWKTLTGQCAEGDFLCF
ncbi:Vesicle transport protein S20 [Geranomyces variabilis]|uniref:Vesicle transport protein S20 n=1 Tax=Geranomyces variabilis TaxID=109894 RepID=A0AAD5XS00_9FUNG|nr:Vesicle transport protein S20 [Geranomyces variabilis]